MNPRKLNNYTVVRVRLGRCLVIHTKAMTPEQAAEQTGGIYSSTQVFEGHIVGLLG